MIITGVYINAVFLTPFTLSLGRLWMTHYHYCVLRRAVSKTTGSFYPLRISYHSVDSPLTHSIEWVAPCCREYPAKWEYSELLTRGLYVVQIQQFLKYFPREQILILNHADIVRNLKVMISWHASIQFYVSQCLPLSSKKQSLMILSHWQDVGERVEKFLGIKPPLFHSGFKPPKPGNWRCFLMSEARR